MNELSMTCPGCGKVTEIDPEWRKKLLNELDPKFPARRAIINCTCGEWQFTIALRAIEL